MRPDEHKKKKNTAYKKKHGITITKEDNKTKSDVDSKSKSATDKFKLTHKDAARSSSKPSDRKSDLTQQKNHTQGARVSHQGAAAKDSSDSESNSSESDSEGTLKQKTYVKKTFQRREIVSNWQKYEITPEVEETSGGNSYEKLLSVTGGGALSHFRFKDELEWEEESSGSISQAGDDEIYNQVFGFNPSELADCLACLPIHQVLGIATDIFSDEQFAENTASANKKLSLWSKDNDGRQAELSNLIPDKLSAETLRTSKSESSIKLMNSSSSQSGARQTADTSPIRNVALPNTKKEPVENSETQTSHNVIAPSISQSSTCQDSNKSPTTDITLPSHISLNKEIPLEDGALSGDSSSELSNCLNHQLLLEDNVLDSLLDLDTPDSQQHPVISTDAGSVASNIQEKSKQSKIDSEISSLPKAVDISSPKGQTEETDLEDWLDSILDD